MPHFDLNALITFFAFAVPIPFLIWFDRPKALQEQPITRQEHV